MWKIHYDASYKLAIILLGGSVAVSLASFFLDSATDNNSAWFQSSGAAWIVSSIIGFLFKIIKNNSAGERLLPSWEELHTEIATAINFYLFPAMAVIGTIISSYGWVLS